MAESSVNGFEQFSVAEECGRRKDKDHVNNDNDNEEEFNEQRREKTRINTSQQYKLKETQHVI